MAIPSTATNEEDDFRQCLKLRTISSPAIGQFRYRAVVAQRCCTAKVCHCLLDGGEAIATTAFQPVIAEELPGRIFRFRDAVGHHAQTVARAKASAWWL